MTMPAELAAALTAVGVDAAAFEVDPDDPDAMDYLTPETVEHLASTTYVMDTDWGCVYLRVYRKGDLSVWGCDNDGESWDVYDGQDLAEMAARVAAECK
ncbi:hypothetical protein Drose_06060 [Dactylosporangium roseum]|uniref:Uncharacterized protein n=1 Tax=Dactylosporangium roseum TaxID=47989 RepID=A0ABY5Z706_9ACTN|nr:hypothetical protein [Dactylosporangium roseum]UWZ37836.1 hypothetical protein Drose_06060 [Dactylosporangium roseum]